jgi:dual specificity phosphatase 12
MIARNIWVGSAADAANVEFLRACDISLVVNCTRTLPFASSATENHRVGVDDDLRETDRMVASIPAAVTAIEKHIKGNRGVLIHCWAGMQRSCAIAAAYLMHKLGLPPHKAMAAIKHVKAEAFDPRPTFKVALERYYATLLTQSST